VQFKRWFADAVAASVPQPDAMTLATATKDGKPSARMVLLKGVTDRGFEFYTNYLSRKGRELAENPYAALVFHWEELGRQVRVEGSVERLAVEESDAYFATRPLDNKLSSWSSAQSEPTTREELDRKFAETKRLFQGRPLPRPQHWGGYRLVPVRIEFWQRRFARLNDRVEYTKNAMRRWSLQRLAP
jgi:pyridoxamine 5'-phosphate oxidase